MDLRLRSGSKERDLWRSDVMALECWLKELFRCSDGVCDCVCECACDGNGVCVCDCDGVTDGEFE